MPPEPNPGDELVDVLDDDGNVVGVATRREIRAGRLPHRCVYVLVFSPAGEILIHRRTTFKDVFPSYWDVTVGGVLGSGEDWHTGVRREAAEELGVEVDPSFLFDVQYRDDRTVAFGRVYRAVHAGPFKLQPSEVEEAEFVSCDRLPELFQQRPFCPDGVAVWSRFTRRNSRPRA